jgi:hypothetical protein
MAEAAKSSAGPGARVLLAIDAPIGVPHTYLGAALKEFPGAGNGFISWLPRAYASADFFSPAKTAKDWTVRHPFFKVPRGRGSLSAFIEAAARQGISLYRKIDVQTGGKSVFAMGLPGQVSPAAQCLWQELIAARTGGMRFRVWPFEGTLDALLGGPDLTVAEIYPRAAYGVALAPTLPAEPMVLAKKKAPVRERKIAELRQSAWVKQWGVRFQDLSWAESSDDEFDACLTASAILRLVLEKRQLSSGADSVSEGGILCV